MKHLTAWTLLLAVAACDSSPSPRKDAATTPSASASASGAATDPVPAKFSIKLDTTKGEVIVSCTRDWAPHGVDNLHFLVREGFFTDVAFFRAVKNFVVQFGIHGDPAVAAKYRTKNITPDKVTQSNTRGTLTYAQAGRPSAPGMTAKSRSTQLFFNLKDNKNLDRMGFAPVCVVAKGMDVIDDLYTGYGEKAGKDQMNIQMKGNTYLKEAYPKLDYLKSASLVDWVEPGPIPEPGEGEDEEGEGGSGGADAEGSGGAAPAASASAATSASAAPSAAPAPKAASSGSK